MRIFRRIRLILARPFFFMADRFTDGVSHYTERGDRFYYAGMSIVDHQFRQHLLIIKKVWVPVPKSKHPIGSYRWLYDKHK